MGHTDACKTKETGMFMGNYEKLAKENTNFRKVLYTGPHSQIVAMSLQANEDIGTETHPAIDQIFIIADGHGEAMVGGEVRAVKEGDIVMVPANTAHNVMNTSHKELKLITIYAPAAHADGTIHVTKADAARE